MPVPSAARKVAAASTSPGTGTRSSGRPPRQVTQTKIVIALAVLAWGARTAAVSLAVVSGTVMSGLALSAKVTRPLLGAFAPGSGAWAASAPYLPPRGQRRAGDKPHATRPAPRAPRPAHARIDGRSPGSRVAARHRLPGFSQWLCGTGSPLTVAGAAAALKTGLNPVLAPHSLLSLLEGPSITAT